MTAVDDVVRLDVSAVQYSVEQRRVVKHVDIVVTTRHSEEGMPYPRISRCDRLKNQRRRMAAALVGAVPTYETVLPIPNACNPMNPTYRGILEPHLAGVAEQCLRHLETANIVPRTT